MRSSILSAEVFAAKGVVDESILLPGAVIEEGARVIKASVGEGAVVGKDACFCGGTARARIAVLGDGERYESC